MIRNDIIEYLKSYVIVSPNAKHQRESLIILQAQLQQDVSKKRFD